MRSANTPTQADPSLQTLQDIRRMMERSSRFMSLSGLSGLSAGVWAVIGAWVARGWLQEYNSDYFAGRAFVAEERDLVELKLLGLGVAVLIAALVSSTWFTWRKARRSGLPVWDPSAKRVLINMAIPLIAGGLFIAGLSYHTEWDLIAPSCLIFYGLALVNASKYTLGEIRYLGLFEIALGLANMYYPQWGLYFWALGFGALHIVYGLIMWWKYERRPES
ncbi:MAG: hypothetical protein Q8932_20345 [Bacteroidota bacterium]|nr:hypothetical protein [Bacteroidota bacterium]MDP4248195.1 hypothetical protein [Bacteroidota bacterium]MDP4252956.1 hypothetical protein [Bacteroidota bacterium]